MTCDAFLQLSADSHACTPPPSSLEWRHVTMHIHASRGLYNLPWKQRHSDVLGSSSCGSGEPATVAISPSTPPSPHPFILSLPPLLLHLSQAPTSTACASPPFHIRTRAHARACDEGAAGGGWCSSEDDLQLRCSASPRTGALFVCIIIIIVSITITSACCR